MNTKSGRKVKGPATPLPFSMAATPDRMPRAFKGPAASSPGAPTPPPTNSKDTVTAGMSSVMVTCCSPSEGVVEGVVEMVGVWDQDPVVVEVEVGVGSRESAAGMVMVGVGGLVEVGGLEGAAALLPPAEPLALPVMDSVGG